LQCVIARPDPKFSFLVSGFAVNPNILDTLENLSVTKAMASIQKDLDEIQRLSIANLPQIDMGATAHLTKALEEHQRQWREIVQPLEKISAGLRIENDFARIIGSQMAKFTDIKLPFESLSESLRQSMDSIQSSLSGAAAASKILLQSFDEEQRLRLEELAKPFQISKAFTESAFSETLKLSLGQLEIAERFRLPALDPIATSAIAKLWQAGDLHERIRFISKDLEKVLQEAAEQAETPVDGKPSAARKQPLIQLDFWTIFNLLLTLVIVAYQEIGSARMEARLSHKIDNGNAATQKQSPIFKRYLSRPCPQGSRGRWAKPSSWPARASPESGKARRLDRPSWPRCSPIRLSPCSASAANGFMSNTSTGSQGKSATDGR